MPDKLVIYIISKRRPIAAIENHTSQNDWHRYKYQKQKLFFFIKLFVFNSRYKNHIIASEKIFIQSQYLRLKSQNQSQQTLAY